MSNLVRPFVNAGTVVARIDNLTKELIGAAKATVDRNFIEMENFAKQNAGWIDRTGDARRSIQKVDMSDDDKILFYLVIGVYYGLYLELANQGKYQILRPTLTVFEPKIKNDLRSLK